ncbi:hypothetical protein KPATCC21470_1254 [Kitasatospora purpeofusca]
MRHHGPTAAPSVRSEISSHFSVIRPPLPGLPGVGTRPTDPTDQNSGSVRR